MSAVEGGEKATAGFEPAIGVLQTPALPLGYVAPLMGPTCSDAVEHSPGLKLICLAATHYNAGDAYPISRPLECQVLLLHHNRAISQPQIEPLHAPPRTASLSDRTLHCTRCGVEFLWPREEQAPAAERPAYCAGCRRLLPAATRERGLVKWFNARRRYGFITRGNGDEIFVHGSQVERAQDGPTSGSTIGRRRLLEGDLVEFAVGESERGPQAETVRILQAAGKREAGREED